MKQIPLTQGYIALVDDIDFEWLNQWKWGALKAPHTVYAVRYTSRAGGKKPQFVYMHRLILEARKGQETDHRNGNGLDNQRANLRFCTSSQNNMNRAHGRGTSVYKGVSWSTRRRKWQVQIGCEGKSVFLGRFDSEEEAACAYNTAALERFGEFAHLNDI